MIGNFAQLQYFAGRVLGICDGNISSAVLISYVQWQHQYADWILMQYSIRIRII